jgi:hypothetical protein
MTKSWLTWTAALALVFGPALVASAQDPLAPTTAHSATHHSHKKSHRQAHASSSTHHKAHGHHSTHAASAHANPAAAPAQ